MRSIRPRPSRFALAAPALLALAGCTHNQPDARFSPETMTLAQTPEDVNNQLIATYDENWRMFWQDLGRFGLTDRPSRLTPEPIPYP